MIIKTIDMNIFRVPVAVSCFREHVHSAVVDCCDIWNGTNNPFLKALKFWGLLGHYGNSV